MTKRNDITLKDMIITAVTKPADYEKIIGIKKRFILLYILLVAVLMSTIQVIIPAAAFAVSIGGPKHFIEETLPAFEYKDGTFSIAHKIDINGKAIRIVADSDVKEYTEKDIDEDKLVEVLVSENNMLMINRMSRENYDLKFKDLKTDKTFTNKNLTELLPYFYISMAFGAVTATMMVIFHYLYNAIFLAVCGVIATMRSPIKLRFKDLYLFAIMARTIPAFIQSLCFASGLKILSSGIISFVFTVAEFVILWFAIKGVENRNVAIRN
ncbi:MAG: DUF1189 domain-containing protein [Lachnospiraceae bacterium]|nr:DUF1189 domain-containing protein [Lachnospiraceae bacterium]